jgi:transposase InsO family protein
VELLKEYPTREVLRLLKIDKSSYYRRRRDKAEGKRDTDAEKVKEIFVEHRRRYGSRRICAEMRAQGYKIGRSWVRRQMREQELRAIQPRSFVPRTTNSRHDGGYSPNLLLEREHPAKPLDVIVGDITYLPLRSGKWCYLATWTDLYTRQILGWAIREDMKAELVVEAFKKMVKKKRLPAGCIIHSDRGSQYASKMFRDLLKLYRCRQSMSRKGETYDNAFAESLFSRYKAELLEGETFFDSEEAHLETFGYIDGYYNTRRRHSSLGYLSPNAFELKFRQKAGRLTAPGFLTKNKTKPNQLKEEILR